MSKFSKALEQAQRERAERAMRQQTATPPLTSAPPAPPPAAPPAPGVPAPPRTPTIPPPPEASAPPRPAPVRPSFNGAPRRASTTARRAAVITGEVESHLVSLVAPSGPEAEQYRALRHMVEQRHKSQALTVIAVSSPGVGDGKTTTAINLAGALAQGSDVSVLLVEADLRRPSIGQVLGFDGAHTLGLVDAILDPSLTLASIVQARPPFNLNVVLAGQIPPSPYEILKSPRLGALLDEARQEYDFIVMDTPPLALVQDCRVVARWVDGMVVVVAAHHTPRSLLENALDAVDPTKLVGLVFNGFDHLGSGRNAGRYPSYYALPDPEDEENEESKLNRITRKVGSLLRRGDRAAARNRRARDRTR